MTVTVIDWTGHFEWTQWDPANPIWEPAGGLPGYPLFEPTQTYNPGSTTPLRAAPYAGFGYLLAAGDPHVRYPLALDLWHVNINLPTLTLPAGATDNGFTVDWKYGWDSMYSAGRDLSLGAPFPFIGVDGPGTFLPNYLSALVGEDYPHALNASDGHPELLGYTVSNHFAYGPYSGTYNPTTPFPVTVMGPGWLWIVGARSRFRDDWYGCKNPPPEWDGQGPRSLELSHSYTAAHNPKSTAEAAVHTTGVV